MLQRNIGRSLATVRDFIRWGASRFGEAGLAFGHGTDNAIDESAALVLHALHLPGDLAPDYLAATLTPAEKARVVALLERRVRERKPAAYLINEAWFAGLPFYVDERVLVPRSPIAELIEHGFEPWVQSEQVGSVLDLCTGSGCIAIACAYAFCSAHVVAADVSAEALEVASINVERHGLRERVELVQSDLFEGLHGRTFDLIVTNPPYVSASEMDHLPVEYGHEPAQGLVSGREGLDAAVQILVHAPEHLAAEGVLVLEVGYSAHALAERFPSVPFTWVDFERGGEGVLVLTRDQLVAYHDVFADRTTQPESSGQ